MPGLDEIGSPDGFGAWTPGWGCGADEAALHSGEMGLCGYPTLESFWNETVGITDRGHLLGSGNGYQKLRSGSRIRQKGDGLPGVDASYLYGLPEITAASSATFGMRWDIGYSTSTPMRSQ